LSKRKRKRLDLIENSQKYKERKVCAFRHLFLLFFSGKNKIFGELINKNRNGSLGCARFDPCPQENNNNNKKIIIRYGNGWRYIARHHHLVGYLRTSVAFIDCLQVRDIPHAADDRSVVFFLDRAQAYHSRGNNGTMAFSLSLSLSLHV
jgi:hypothetical protein